MEKSTEEYLEKIRGNEKSSSILSKILFLAVVTSILGGAYLLEKNYNKSHYYLVKEKQKIDSIYTAKKDSLGKFYRAKINFWEGEKQKKLKDLEDKFK